MELIKTGGAGGERILGEGQVAGLTDRAIDRGRVARLGEYLRALAGGSATRAFYDAYADALESATPVEVNAALDAVLASADDVTAWKGPVSRFIRAVGKALDAAPLPEYPPGGLFAHLSDENAALARALAELSALAAPGVARGEALGVARGAGSLGAIQGRLLALSGLRDHYVALQNQLFPLFERYAPDAACVRLMWAIEDDVLDRLRRACECPIDTESDRREFWKVYGDFFLEANALAYREKRILLPVAYRAIGDAAGSARDAGSVALGSPGQGQGESGPGDAGAGVAFACQTGALSTAQLEALFRVLPVDVAFIGADDRVAFYSDPPHRVFPRSPAVIGRRVQDCHPPKSVAVVNEILRSFRLGQRDSAEFWLEAGGRFIHIEYFALRDPAGAYLGTLEVTQDATDLRALTGEKRLL